MVIVTKRCFILAERILHCVIQEEPIDKEERRLFQAIRQRHVNGKKSRRQGAHIKREEPTRFHIYIRYQPISTNNPTNSRGDHIEECSIITYSKETAESLFSDIVTQYREQNPDQLYLDKVAERFLASI